MRYKESLEQVLRRACSHTANLVSVKGLSHREREGGVEADNRTTGFPPAGKEPGGDALVESASDGIEGFRARPGVS